MEKPMFRKTTAYLKSNTGVTLVEYGLIAALLAVAVAVILGTLGDNMNGVFTSINNRV